MSIKIINPATGELQASYTLMPKTEVLNIIDAMADEQHSWSKLKLQERLPYLTKLAEVFRNNIDNYANIITAEMGKPITQAKAEIEKCAWLCDYYVETAADHLQQHEIKTDKKKSYTYYAPLGIVFAIMPWNFPFWQVMRFAVPNIIAGNAGLLKHAPNSMGTGLAIEQAFRDAGFPKNIFRSLIADVDVVSDIIEHKAVCGVTLTGSERAGVAVAAEAGKALKKVVLELGGTDPYLILEDADLKHAAQQCITSRLNNAGQVCIAAKRIIIAKDVYDKFMQLLLEQVATFQLGDPTDPNTTMGPMAREDLRATLHDQVLRSITAGATCLTGGKLPEGPGCYYPATVLTDVSPGMPAHDEELFGPVVVVFKADSNDAAIAMANDTNYGLSAAVFTQDLEQGEAIARQLNAGTVSVNGFVASDPRLPFGGIKRSGYGREMAAPGIHEFMNLKTIVVA